ncbi:MAG: outer membrane beta-barrel protein [Proteobacteria bacterium]|nr:outer membrane beta-barrel protein [Pseudomonadota bacterium]
MNKTILFASLLALAGASSVAAAADNSWYVRGDIGSGRISVNGFGHSNNSTGGALDLGYYFTPNFGVEGGYVNFGSHNGVKVDGFGAGVVGKVNFNQDKTGFFIDGRLGLNHLTADGYGTSTSTTKPYFGAGFGYDFNPNFGLSANYLYNNAGKSGVSAHAQLISLGGEVRF